jgi:hypothetical protein
MLKIISGTFIVLATMLLIVMVIGLRNGPSVDTKLDFRINFSQDYVFSILTDIEKYPERKKGLKNIEVLETTGNVILKWKENYKNGTWREYEIIRKNEPTIFDYEIYDSSNDHTALITMDFMQNDDFTTVNMTEVGKIDNTFKRGLRGILGDNSYLKSEGKWLRVAILSEQIERK